MKSGKAVTVVVLGDGTEFKVDSTVLDAFRAIADKPRVKLGPKSISSRILMGKILFNSYELPNGQKLSRSSMKPLGRYNFRRAG